MDGSIEPRSKSSQNTPVQEDPASSPAASIRWDASPGSFPPLAPPVPVVAPVLVAAPAPTPVPTVTVLADPPLPVAPDEVTLDAPALPVKLPSVESTAPMPPEPAADVAENPVVDPSIVCGGSPGSPAREHAIQGVAPATRAASERAVKRVPPEKEECPPGFGSVTATRRMNESLARRELRLDQNCPFCGAPRQAQFRRKGAQELRDPRRRPRDTRETEDSCRRSCRA